MSWLEEHIETFVKPILKDEFDKKPLGFFKPEELTVVKNHWRAIKRNAEGKQILLPGRDVFIFEILARRENYPTIFMPECSRMTVHATTIPKNDVYLFDTGFAGSIPNNLGIETFGLMSHRDRPSSKQVFPRLTLSRGLALKIESTPKYWESGRMSVTGTIRQPMANLQEFARAARLTIEVYTNSSPKFIPHNRPIKREGVNYG
jgi:hypothetical protein